PRTSPRSPGDCRPPRPRAPPKGHVPLAYSRPMGTEAPAPAKHIRLTSHPAEGAWGALPIHWGRADPHERGPIVGSTANRSQRNVIGTHSGSYGVYRARRVAGGG